MGKMTFCLAAAATAAASIQQRIHAVSYVTVQGPPVVSHDYACSRLLYVYRCLSNQLQLR